MSPDKQWFALGVPPSNAEAISAIMKTFPKLEMIPLEPGEVSGLLNRESFDYNKALWELEKEELATMVGNVSMAVENEKVISMKGFKNIYHGKMGLIKRIYQTTGDNITFERFVNGSVQIFNSDLKVYQQTQRPPYNQITTRAGIGLRYDDFDDAVLTPRQLRVLVKRFSLDGLNKMSNSQITDWEGITNPSALLNLVQHSLITAIHNQSPQSE